MNSGDVRYGWKADVEGEGLAEHQRRENEPMRSVILMATVMLISGCAQSDAKMSEAELDEMQQILPGMTAECVDKARMGGIAALSSIETDKCFQMEPSRRWAGVWRNDFEGQRFCPAPATECSIESPGDEIWLRYSKGLRRAGVEPREGVGGLYTIEFIGRRTLIEGAHGHHGAYDHEIIVDRLTSISATSR